MEICNALAAAWADPSAVMAAPELARATALALAEWDVVTVWCEKGLVKFYESCGYVYEPAKGRRYAEDDEAVLRATRDSVRDARGISTGG